MKTDYAYCDNDHCIHRRACRRSIGNYFDEDVEAWIKTGRNQFIDHRDCEPTLKIESTNDYGLLDRFRYSDGSEKVKR
jgi:ferredoxin